MAKRKHHSLPMTYKPKIPAVFGGTCTQTIRVGSKYEVGDTLTIFEWSGQPYRSKWGRRLKAKVFSVDDVLLSEFGIGFAYGDTGHYGRASWRCCDKIACLDGIDPPTGEELKRVLEAFHGPFPSEGVEAQIITWEPEERSEG
jgi:hypothetical protein